MDFDCDIAVVGGGATGLAAGIALSKAGFSVCQFAPPAKFPPGRTAALFSGSIDLLNNIGAWSQVEKSATSLRAIRIVDATNRLIRAPEVTFYASEIGLQSFGYNVANGDLVKALLSLSKASMIEEPVTAIEHQPECAIVHAAGRSYQTRLVVGADGSGSLARQFAGIAMRTRDYRQSALVTTLKVQFPHDNTSTEFHTSSGPFTLVPYSSDLVSLVWVGRPDDLDRARQLSVEEFGRLAEDKSYSILGKLSPDSNRVIFPLRVGTADRFSGNRTILIGEAAHVFPPIGAQGLNLGFRDIVSLVASCARNIADPGSVKTLSSYQQSRSADITSRTAAVDLLNRSLLTGFLPVQLVRGLGLSLAAGVPALKRFLMRQGMAGSSSDHGAPRAIAPGG